MKVIINNKKVYVRQRNGFLEFYTNFFNYIFNIVSPSLSIYSDFDIDKKNKRIIHKIKKEDLNK